MASQISQPPNPVRGALGCVIAVVEVIFKRYSEKKWLRLHLTTEQPKVIAMGDLAGLRQVGSSLIGSTAALPMPHSGLKRAPAG
jgi:hypothetical protein